jgi:hypothetical protein
LRPRRGLRRPVRPVTPSRCTPNLPAHPPCVLQFARLEVGGAAPRIASRVYHFPAPFRDTPPSRSSQQQSRRRRFSVMHLDAIR